ncbi:MAG: hypothetical protein KatS3mg124_2390 [Porticoccaceae bacterium]|nr:MAG: hypothetical protein KatS3mg124_2390 [Porticoccaceae bacterium]
MRDRVRRLAALRRWHRRLGLPLALWLAWLAASGVALNHGAALGLDRRPLPSWLAESLYGVAVEPPQGVALDELWLGVAGETLFAGERPVDRCSRLVGAARSGELVYAACPEAVYALTRNGELVEAMTAGLPGVVASFGRCGELPCLVSGDTTFALDPVRLVWVPHPASPQVAPAAPPPPDLLPRLAARAVPAEFTWERLVRDLHSGALFGLGPWLADLFAVGLVLLSALGFALWRLSSPRGRRA